MQEGTGPSERWWREEKLTNEAWREPDTAQVIPRLRAGDRGRRKAILEQSAREVLRGVSSRIEVPRDGILKRTRVPPAVRIAGEHIARDQPHDPPVDLDREGIRIVGEDGKREDGCEVFDVHAHIPRASSTGEPDAANLCHKPPPQVRDVVLWIALEEVGVDPLRGRDIGQ